VPIQQSSQLIEALHELARAAPSAAAAGLGVVGERIKYEQLVKDMLGEAVRELNRLEGAQELGGLNLALEYHTEFGSTVDAAISTGRGNYIAIEIKHSFGKIGMIEMNSALQAVTKPSPEPKVLELLFISNSEPVSTIDVQFLSQARLPTQFQFIRISQPEDLPKAVWAIRSAFQIHG
jgi:hypothetical protein